MASGSIQVVPLVNRYIQLLAVLEGQLGRLEVEETCPPRSREKTTCPKSLCMLPLLLSNGLKKVRASSDISW